MLVQHEKANPRRSSAGLLSALLFFAAQALPSQVTAPPPHTGELARGGQYRGPGDLIPPNLPFFDPDTAPECQAHDPSICNPSLLPTSGCPSCSLPAGILEWEPWQDGCVACSDEEGTAQECFNAFGYNLTFGELKEFCDQGIDCGDPNGNVTVCIDDLFVCEVHVLQSDWINAAVFPGKGICSPVPLQACLDGQPLFSNPHSIEVEHRGTGGCQAAEVCITFARDCMCAAVDRWNALLGGATNYDNKWLLHVGFTYCEACECNNGP